MSTTAGAKQSEILTSGFKGLKEIYSTPSSPKVDFKVILDREEHAGAFLAVLLHGCRITGQVVVLSLERRSFRETLI